MSAATSAVSAPPTPAPAAAASAEASEGVIKKLPKDVIDRIAAGEVVQRPCHAVKELLENAIDAHATSVGVVAKNGGTKLSVTDNGDGIRQADMPRLCERFATSKLAAFDDLRNIGTFGFRGEALASISYVARVRVVTRRQASATAYQATYSKGQMREEAPEAAAGPRGTTVYVDDLFYNLPVRKASLRSAATEYARVLDVVRKYAARYPHVRFSCRRDVSAPPDAATAPTARVVDLAQAHAPAEWTKQALGSVYGAEMAKHLLHVRGSVELPPPDEGFGEVAADEASAAPRPAATAEFDAFFSSPDHVLRKGVSTYFINGRLVECSALHKAVTQAYSAHVGKGKYPFIFASLQVPSSEVDVNVHPTKAEVALLNEPLITSRVHDAVARKLEEQQQKSKAFSVVVPAGEAPLKPSSSSSSPPPQQHLPPPPPATPAKRKASEVSPPPPLAAEEVAFTPGNRSIFVDSVALQQRGADLSIEDDARQRPEKRPKLQQLAAEEASASAAAAAPQAQPQPRPPPATVPDIALDKVREAGHPVLKEVLRGCTRIGLVVPRRVEGRPALGSLLVQTAGDVYSVDVGELLREAAFQALLVGCAEAAQRPSSGGGGGSGRRGGRGGGGGGGGVANTLRFSNPPRVADLCDVALSLPGVMRHGEGLERDEICRGVVRRLTEKGSQAVLREMGLVVTDDARVVAIPRLWEGYVPPLMALPLVLLRLATEVEWDFMAAEASCAAVYLAAAKELSRLFVPPALDRVEEPTHALLNPAGVTVEELLEEEVMPFVASPRFFPPQAFASGVVVKVATTASLCATFERAHCQPHSDVIIP